MKKFLKNSLKDKKGLTLVEILVSIVILGILVGPFLNVFEFALESNKTSNRIADATFIANQRMEYLYDLCITKEMIGETIAEIKDLPETTQQSLINPYKFNIKNGDYVEEVVIDTDILGNGLDKVIVNVLYKDKLMATVENYYEWK